MNTLYIKAFVLVMIHEYYKRHYPHLTPPSDWLLNDIGNLLSQADVPGTISNKIAAIKMLRDDTTPWAAFDPPAAIKTTLNGDSFDEFYHNYVALTKLPLRDAKLIVEWLTDNRCVAYTTDPHEA